MFRTLLFSTALISVSTSLYAYDDPVTTPPVVVTPARAPVPLNHVASSMTVINASDIEKQNKPTVIELLREVPGITIANNGGPTQPTSLFMRGTNSNHVLVVIDGVRVNDPSDTANRFDFSNLATDNIERIEILRGPQSTLYGSQAIGGVINIFTKEGKGTPKTTGFAEYGSYNTRRVGLGNSGEIGKTSYSIAASNGHSNGISSLSKRNGGFEHDGNDTYNFSANVISKLTDNFAAKFNARYIRTNTEFDSPGTFSIMAPRPADDPEPINDNRQFNGRVAGELSLLDGIWTQELGVSTLHVNRDAITSYYDPNIFDSPFGRQQFLGSRQTLDWVHHVKASDNQLITFGYEVSKENFKSNQSSEVDVANQAYFIDDQLNLGKSFFVNASARTDIHQTFGRHFTWKVAPGYRIHETGTTLKAAYGTGFKAPSLAQLFAPGTGNPDVDPETSKGWDLGFEQSLLGDKLVFGSTFFRNDIINLLGNSNTYPYPTINTGKARTEGVENVLTFRPTVDWDIHASYVYTLSQDRAADKDLLRRPRHQVIVGAGYDYSAKGDVGLNARYESMRRDGDIITFAPLNAKQFTVVDLYTNYRITPNITAYGRIDNLLDKRYEEVAGYGQPGLSGYAGVKFQY